MDKQNTKPIVEKYFFSKNEPKNRESLNLNVEHFQPKAPNNECKCMNKSKNSKKNNDMWVGIL
jgi:hypothetical protein